LDLYEGIFRYNKAMAVVLTLLASLAIGASAMPQRLRGQAPTAGLLTAKVNQSMLPFDCYIKKDKGKEYEGLKDFSQSGRTCMNWLEEKPSKKYDPSIKGIGNHHYCRNPKGEKDRPWCYTVDPKVEWEFCEVPECPEKAKELKGWEAPKGAKSDGKEPCTYKPPEDKGYKKYKDGRACMDHQGDKWWLITNNKTKVADDKACKKKCDLLPGTEYFTFFGADDKHGHNCGCYRECILVPKAETKNSPTAYRLDIRTL